MDIYSKTVSTLEFDKVKEELSKFAKFSQSKALCLRAFAYSDVEKIQNQIELTREAKKILESKEFYKYVEICGTPTTPTSYRISVDDIKEYMVML